MKPAKVLLLVLAFCTCCQLRYRSQNLEIGGLFPTIEHSGTFNRKFGYSIYYFAAINLMQLNSASASDHPDFGAIYAEQALHFMASEKWVLSASHVYERQNPFLHTFRNENRFYLQATCKHGHYRLSFKHRVRYDGRYIEDRRTGKWPYSDRMRYLAGFSFPLKAKETSMYLTGYNEFFLNLDRNAIAVYGENWASLALGFKSSGMGAWELGPLYIFWVTNERRDLMNFYYLQLTWITHLKLHKNES